MHLECLDARDAWPPFLRPGVLAGLGAYERWESRLLRDGLAPVVTGTRHLGESLNHVGRWTEALAHWKASDGDLAVLIDRVPWPANRIPQTAPSTEALDVVVDELMAQVPAEWRVSAWPDGLPDATMDGAPITQVEAEAALARYLALRLIGSWVSYQGAGLRSVVASLISADALATAALVRTAAAVPVTTGHVMSAIRAADWLQLHLLDREPWAAWCRAAESTVGLTRLLSVVSAAHHARAALAWAPAAH